MASQAQGVPVLSAARFVWMATLKLYRVGGSSCRQSVVMSSAVSVSVML